MGTFLYTTKRDSSYSYKNIISTFTLPFSQSLAQDSKSAKDYNFVYFKLPIHFGYHTDMVLPKLPESSEPQQSERDVPPPRPPKTNQEEAAPPPRPPKTYQHTAVSDHALLRVLVEICNE